MITSTDTISLRYYLSTDIEPLFEDYTSDIDSSKYLARKPHSALAQTESMLQKLSSQSSLVSLGKCVWVISQKETEVPVGLLTLLQQAGSIELHLGIRKSFTRQGYATKALSLAAQYLLVSATANEIVSFTDIEHFAAQSAFEKAGFSCISRQNKFYIAPQLAGCQRDVYRYKYNA